MTNINGYELLSDLKNDNSGFAKWGFAWKNGYELFIKQFLSPVYPVDENLLSAEQISRKRQICMQFEKRKRTFYDRLNQCNTGNIITIIDFFRFESKYYVVTDKVDTVAMSVEQISQLPTEKKLLIIKTILYNINALHEKGIVHADIKPSNILIKSTSRGFYTAKLIDFDSGFIEHDPSMQVNAEGDLVYLSPEVYMAIADEEYGVEKLTHKLDIFALGILFHQYLTGGMPVFDRSNYDYLFEAVLDGGNIMLNSRLDKKSEEIISSMLSKNPADRPEAWEISEKWFDIKRENRAEPEIKAKPVAESHGTLKITLRRAGDIAGDINTADRTADVRDTAKINPFLKRAGEL